MASKNIGIKESVYERLKAHKRGDESFSEALDRILHELDADWRTNAGFLADEGADDLEAAVDRGLDEVGESFTEVGDEIDERLQEES